jgi:hypothetical protein
MSFYLVEERPRRAIGDRQLSQPILKTSDKSPGVLRSKNKAFSHGTPLCTLASENPKDSWFGSYSGSGRMFINEFAGVGFGGLENVVDLLHEMLSRSSRNAELGWQG